nr:(d)CMP kinase [Gordonia hirsuta]
MAAAHRLAESGELRSGILAIDGPSGSGKSTFADALAARLAELGRPPLLIRTDDYATWDDPASWWPELESDVLAPFGRSHDVTYRPRTWYDGAAHPGPVQHLRWAPLMILEGVTAARQAISSRVARALWIDGPDAPQRLERAVGRDGEDQRELLAAWQRFEEGWFAVDRTRERCQIVRY